VVKDGPQPLYPMERAPTANKLEAGWTPRPAWAVLKTSTDERAGWGGSRDKLQGRGPE